MNQLPERIRAHQIFLATQKSANIERFKAIYGDDFSAEDPELVSGNFIPEPLSPDPTVAARFKTRRVLEGVIKNVAKNKRAVALAADVIFVNGSRHFKPERLEDTDEEILAQTINWYCVDAFVVHWLIAFAVQSNDGLNRIAVLDVEADFPEPLTPQEVTKTFNSQMNSRLPLVEKGAQGGVKFSLSNSHRFDKVEIDYELARQLIVDRVLPFALLESLLLETAELVDVDDETWEFVVISLLGINERTAYEEQ